MARGAPATSLPHTNGFLRSFEVSQCGVSACGPLSRDLASSGTCPVKASGECIGWILVGCIQSPLQVQSLTCVPSLTPQEATASPSREALAHTSFQDLQSVQASTGIASNCLNPLQLGFISDQPDPVSLHGLADSLSCEVEDLAQAPSVLTPDSSEQLHISDVREADSHGTEDTMTHKDISQNHSIQAASRYTAVVSHVVRKIRIASPPSK